MPPFVAEVFFFLFFLQSFLHAAEFLRYSLHLCMYPVWPHFTLGQMFPVARCGRKTYRSKNMSNRWRETEQERERKVCLWKNVSRAIRQMSFFSPLPAWSHTVSGVKALWKVIKNESCLFSSTHTLLITRLLFVKWMNKSNTDTNINTQIMCWQGRSIWTQQWEEKVKKKHDIQMHTQIMDVLTLMSKTNCVPLSIVQGIYCSCLGGRANTCMNDH